MIKNREGFLVGEKIRECTNCGMLFNKTSKTVTLCNLCNSTRVKSVSVEQKMLNRAKSRSKYKNLEFNIDISDIIIPEYCPILNIKLSQNSGKSGGKSNSPALDRIDNLKGYVKGNVMVISHLANQMKASATPEQLIVFATYIIEKYKKN